MTIITLIKKLFITFIMDNLTPEQILDYVLKGIKVEDVSLDYTEDSDNHDSLGEKIAAFATSGGGWLIVGISKKREIIGIKTDKQTFVSKIGTILRNCNPTPTVGEIKFIDADTHSVALFLIIGIGGGVCSYKGVPYHRVQDSAKKMEMSDLIIFLNKSGFVSWERRNSNASVDAIDEEEVSFYLTKVVEKSPITEQARENFLRMNKAVTDDKKWLTNLGLIALAKKPASYLPQCKIQLIRFKGIEPGNRIASYLAELPARQMIAACINFLKLNLPIRERYEGALRIEEPIVPEIALREAVVNLVVHRDYSDTQESLIRIFDDRVEFQNPGAPSQEDMKKIQEQSIPFHRNPDLYNFLRLAHQGEGAGQGLPVMRSELVRVGLKDPEITTVYNIFHLAIKFEKREPKTIEEAILWRGKERKVIYTNEVMAMFDLSRPTVIKILNRLVKDGYAKHFGSTRKSRYIFEGQTKEL